MSMSDPIADMLTRIRNAIAAKHKTVDISHSELKTQIARILKKEGYISDYVVEGGVPSKIIRLYLKYLADSEPAIRGISRVSKPGLRTFSGASEMPRALGGMGTVIVTTSIGVITGRESRSKNVGGEVLCEIW